MATKFWTYSLLFTLLLLLIFFITSYTAGIYNHGIGHHTAILVTGLAITQSLVNLIYGMLHIKQLTSRTALPGLFAMTFPLLVTLYTWNCLFISC